MWRCSGKVVGTIEYLPALWIDGITPVPVFPHNFKNSLGEAGIYESVLGGVNV
jgi:hypothetical protein